MYIGIDLDVSYRFKRKQGQLIKSRRLIRSYDVNEVIHELNKLDSKDFLEARVVHKMTNVDKRIESREELLDEVYKYLFYVPKYKND